MQILDKYVTLTNETNYNEGFDWLKLTANGNPDKVITITLSIKRNK